MHFLLIQSLHGVASMHFWPVRSFSQYQHLLIFCVCGALLSEFFRRAVSYPFLCALHPWGEIFSAFSGVAELPGQ